MISSPMPLKELHLDRIMEARMNKIVIPKAWSTDGLLSYVQEKDRPPEFEGFIYALVLLLHLQSKKTKVKFLFDLHDKNLDGHLSKAELGAALEKSMQKSGLAVDPQLVEELCQTLVAEIAEKYKNKGPKDVILADSFVEYVTSNEKLENNIVASIDKSIIPQIQTSKKNPFINILNYTKPEYWQNNRSHVLSVTIFCSLLVLSMVVRGSQFIDAKNADDNKRNFSIIIARACGQGIHYCLFFLILLMCRPLITLLRKTGFNHYLPLDLHVTYHKSCGVLVSFFSFIHGVCHIINLSKSVVYNTEEFFRLNNIDKPVRTLSYSQWLFTTESGLFGTIDGVAYPSGVMLSFLLMVILVGAIPAIRRRGYFEIFYWSHLNYIFFMLICIFHAPSTWLWLVVPLILFILSKCLVFARLFFGYRISEAVECNALQSKVTKLVLNKEFDFSPGDYVFINIPKISRFEWHPFTISSAPEVENSFSLHIRSAGGWTNALYNFIKEGNERARAAAEKVSRMQRLISSIGKKNNKIGVPTKVTILPEVPHEQLLVYIDGPHGAPSSSIFMAEHAVLVATGIGVTPFASILQSLLERIIRGKSIGSIRRVDFIWVNREYRSLEWFLKLLRKLETSIQDCILDIHLYVTAAPTTDQTDTMSLALALELLYTQSSRDLITGLTTKCQAGRPNWEKVLGKISEKAQDKVTLFYCGAPQAADVIQPLCDKFSFEFKKEIF